ncbi:hypothetical protein [Streptomyces sparsogenes]|nr:hypothetical protein [Streptomyces sparsogenes]
MSGAGYGSPPVRRWRERLRTAAARSGGVLTWSAGQLTTRLTLVAELVL